MKRLFWMLGFCITLVLPLQAQVYPDYTSTTVNDIANLLPAEAEARVGNVLTNLRADTGVEMTLLTLPAAAEYLGDLSIPDYATNLFNRWGVGDRTRNDGILVIIFRQDREMRIALGSGYGFEWDRAAREAIERGFIPKFRQYDYAGGIEDGIAQTISRIVVPFQNGDPAPKRPFDWAKAAFYAVFGGVLAFIFGKKPFDRYRLRRQPCPQCGQVGGLKDERETTQAPTRKAEGRGVQHMRCKYCSYHNQTPFKMSRKRSSSGTRFGGGSSSGGGASGKW